MNHKKGMVKKGLEIAVVVCLLSMAACGMQRGQEDDDESISIFTAPEDGAGSGGDMSENDDGENVDGHMLEIENGENTDDHTDALQKQGEETENSTDQGADVLSQWEAYLEEQEQMELDTDKQIEEAALSIGQILGERIYELRKPISGATDFCGEWNRTQIHTGTDAKLMITDQSNEKFTFTLDCHNFFNSGSVEGDAWFVTPNLAIARVDFLAEEVQYITFLWSGESLNVTATAMGFSLGLGNRVWADGEYCKGEPVYTNAGQFEQYIDEELDVFMRSHLSEESYGYDFRNTAEIGVIVEKSVVLADGSRARLLRGYMPLNGLDSFEILVTEDGRIYADVLGAGFITNIDGVEVMPGWEIAE